MISFKMISLSRHARKQFNFNLEMKMNEASELIFSLLLGKTNNQHTHRCIFLVLKQRWQLSNLNDEFRKRVRNCKICKQVLMSNVNTINYQNQVGFKTIGFVLILIRKQVALLPYHPYFQVKISTLNSTVVLFDVFQMHL